MKEKTFHPDICNASYFPTAYAYSLSFAQSDKTSMRVERSWMLALGARVEHARVDPHVNCFISRRLDARRIREKERALTTPTTVERNAGEPSGLRARYDRGSPPDFILLCGPILCSPSRSPGERSMFAVRLEPFVSTKGTATLSHRIKPDDDLLSPRVKSKKGKMDFQCTR